MPKTLAGSGESLAGEKRALRAAASAAWVRRLLPAPPLALVTSPFSSTMIWTSTLPCSPVSSAAKGSSGCGTLMAALRSAASETWATGVLSGETDGISLEADGAAVVSAVLLELFLADAPSSGAGETAAVTGFLFSLL